MKAAIFKHSTPNRGEISYELNKCIRHPIYPYYFCLELPFGLRHSRNTQPLIFQDWYQQVPSTMTQSKRQSRLITPFCRQLIKNYFLSGPKNIYEKRPLNFIKMIYVFFNIKLLK